MFLLLYNIGEFHQMKSNYRKSLQKNDWVKIVEREKRGKDTYVTIEDRNGVLYTNVSVKKLRRKAR